MADEILAEQQGRLLLYREASRLSRALRDYSAAALPELDTFSIQKLLECVDRYCGALEKLNVLSNQVRETDAGAESAEETTACEELRSAIRADLDAASAFAGPCRKTLQRWMAASKGDLLLAQKKKKLTAYVCSPLLGQDGTSYDRRR